MCTFTALTPLVIATLCLHAGPGGTLRRYGRVASTDGVRVSQAVPTEPTGLREASGLPTTEGQPWGDHYERHLFDARLEGARLLFRIEPSDLGTEMFITARVVGSVGGSGYPGEIVLSRIVRWEREGSNVLLRAPSHQQISDPTSPVLAALSLTYLEPVLSRIPIEQTDSSGGLEIDVTTLFLTDLPREAIVNHLPSVQGGALDDRRSFVKRVRGFATTVEIDVLHTVVVPETARVREADPLQPQSPRGQSVAIRWSVLRLPESPMAVRLWDSRVPFFAIPKFDYTRLGTEPRDKQYVLRFRLEKKDPGLRPSDPLSPIVFFIDPAMPLWIRAWIKRGVESWNRAFETAGFTNAIVAREPPPDSAWSIDDARVSAIRWVPAPIESGDLRLIPDPRTGEILRAEILLFDGLIDWLRRMIFVQLGPLLPSARELPVADSLVGRLLTYVTAHEVGHAVGLAHNFKASYAYPIDSIRSRQYVRRLGFVASVMDYARINWVAEPADSMDVDDLVARVGRYDEFAIEWGYGESPKGRTRTGEPVLDNIARLQDAAPEYRNETIGLDDADRGWNQDAVGDADPVRAARLGMSNLRRVTEFFVPMVRAAGMDRKEIVALYKELVEQWSRELMPVVRLVGSVDSRELRSDQLAPFLTPTPFGTQKEAVRYLAATALAETPLVLSSDILELLPLDTAFALMQERRLYLLRNLLDDARLARLNAFEVIPSGDRQYTTLELLADVRGAIWGELKRESVRVDPVRMDLQWAHLELMMEKLGADHTGLGGEARRSADSFGHRFTAAAVRRDLVTLHGVVRGAIGKAADVATRAHLSHVEHAIGTVLR